MDYKKQMHLNEDKVEIYTQDIFNNTAVKVNDKSNSKLDDSLLIDKVNMNRDGNEYVPFSSFGYSYFKYL